MGTINLTVKVVRGKKKGFKKLFKRLTLLQMYYLTVGIHRREGLRIINQFGYNLATIANKLLEGYSFTQSSTKVFYNKQGEKIGVIPKGTQINVPARDFIRLSKYSDIFSSLKEYLKTLFSRFLSFSGTRGLKLFWNDLGERTEGLMKSLTSPTGPLNQNSGLTSALKGFNRPLFETGRLFNAITFKVNKGWIRGRGNKRTQKLIYLEEADKLLDNMGK